MYFKEYLTYFFKKKKWEKIPKRDLYEELKKYDTFSFRKKEESCIDKIKGGITGHEEIGRINYLLNMNFKNLKREKIKEYGITYYNIIFIRKRNNEDHEEGLSISTYGIKEVQRIEVSSERGIYYILITFNDETDIAIECNREHFSNGTRIPRNTPLTKQSNNI